MRKIRLDIMCMAIVTATGTWAASTSADTLASRIAIVVAEQATPAERNAADQLQRYLGKIYGVEFDVIAEPAEERDHIFVGRSQWTQGIDLGPLGTEGIVIQTRERDMILIGGPPRGTLNAVFTFLQDEMGCRWYAPDEQLIPERKLSESDLSQGLRSLVGELDVRYMPPFTHRQYFGQSTQDVEFAVKNRLNGRNWQRPIPEEWGGNVYMAQPTGGHTLIRSFLKPDDHFDTHPEWFAWREEAGEHQTSQPCLTHPEVHEQVTVEVLAYLEEHYPTWEAGPKIVSVSNADNDRYCECERCTEVYEREGAKSGALLELVNAVADAVAEDYPDVLVSTLAYWKTSTPPARLRARPNVLIHLGTMQRDHKVGVDQTKYGDYLQRWGRVAQHLYIWDYDTNYHNYMRPHPSYRAVPRSLKFFRVRGVTGVFVQGGWGKPELHNMRAWVNGQLLWDPSRNPRALMREFAEAYYGEAASYVLDYMETIYRAVQRAEKSYLSVYGTTDTWLKLPDMNRAQELITQARTAVEDDERLRERIDLLQMGLDMIWLERYEELRNAAEETNAPFNGPDDPLALVDHYAENPLNVATMREGQSGDYGQFLSRIRETLTSE
ncbi:DUF4838 domain-containing protein [Phycisphaerales bacterium AB-hyl4]|uniref:DUF4838 domain-containing protein n=1 Tax=Natronomicrosphaera hydrolytica TaxID=3242702 RepID=A0ABV4U5V8_9BACT